MKTYFGIECEVVQAFEVYALIRIDGMSFIVLTSDINVQ